MSQRRRWNLTGAAIGPALVLVVLRLYGWFGAADSGTVRFAGFAPTPMDTGTANAELDAGLPAMLGSGLGSGLGFGGPDWSDAALVVVVALIVIGTAAYYGVTSLDAERGTVGVFILGWGATALAAGAGELALREFGSSSDFGWFARAPLTGDLLAGGSPLVVGYGALLGWIVGTVMAVTFVRTRPSTQ